MAKIQRVTAREILDSRGNPTVEAEVKLENGMKAWSQVPSGASTGDLEALELRDGDVKRYGGKGVQKAVAHVNGVIAEKVTGMDVTDQKSLDDAMIALDGTPHKSRLGANAILSVSLAACRAAAMAQAMPLYMYIAQLHGAQRTLRIPTPMFNVINGGQHADSGLAIQEYMIVPHGVQHFHEQLRAGAEIFHTLQKHLADGGFATGVGDEGGFAPRLADNTAPLDAIATATEKAGYTMGTQIGIGIDAAANSFYHADCAHYAFSLENTAYTVEELLAVYDGWVRDKYVMSIEDGLSEHDWDGWHTLYQKFHDRVMLVGDDLLVTNVTHVQKAVDTQACNAALIKPNQIGTLTETLACVQLAQEHDMRIIVSHRSGETIDDFIADLAVGVGADFIKSGSLSRAERLCKYNRLLTIEEQMTT